MPDTAPHRNPWVDPISTPDKWFQWLKRKLEIDPPESLPAPSTPTASGDGAFHGAQMSMDGNSGVTAGLATVIEFDQVDLDSDGYCDTVDNQFVVPAGLQGVYLITVTALYKNPVE